MPCENTECAVKAIARTLESTISAETFSNRTLLSEVFRCFDVFSIQKIDNSADDPRAIVFSTVKNNLGFDCFAVVVPGAMLSQFQTPLPLGEHPEGPVILLEQHLHLQPTEHNNKPDRRKKMELKYTNMTLLFEYRKGY